MEPRPPFDQWLKRIPRRPLVNRDNYIVEQCRGKDVIHLGATDSPFTAESAKAGRLLHQHLRPVARSLVGIDHDRAAIELLRRDYGIDDIIHADLSAGNESLPPPAEVVVCGDIIEHVNSVGQLLTYCSRLCRPDGCILVSTINALALKPALRALAGREAVHPDHVAYYSYGTMGVALWRFGFEPVETVYFCYETVSRWVGFLFRALYRVAPQSADGILIRARRMAEAGGGERLEK